MRLTVKGDISPFYVQTLCLLFYPGSRFSDRSDDGISVDVTLNKDNGSLNSSVVIDDGVGEYRGSYSLPLSAQLSRPSMAEKIALGKAFLEAGKKATGTVPPWGILTGVRPSKLARWDIERGLTVEEAADVFRKDYSVSADKAKLSCSVAQAELKLLNSSLYGKCSVYIAIPFCPTRCSYCSFVSFTSERLLSLIPEYLETLKGEIVRTAELIRRLGMDVSTVYIGGGTPTVLNEDQLDSLLDCICASFDVRSLMEFTLEAGRPDTITEAKMKSAVSHGVTRVSVNTQTLNDSVLSHIGRKHTSADFFDAYRIARESGVRDINVDLIAGLPRDDSDSFSDTLDRVAALNPENITVHAFCVKKSADMRQSGDYDLRDAHAARSVAYAQRALDAKGYIPYYMYRQKNAVGNLENVGYSIPGHEGLYNVLMMEEIQSIFAVGASAVTKLVKTDRNGKPAIKRIAENKYPYEYLREKNGDDAEELFEKKSNDICSFFFDE